MTYIHDFNTELCDDIAGALIRKDSVRVHMHHVRPIVLTHCETQMHRRDDVHENGHGFDDCPEPRRGEALPLP